MYINTRLPARPKQILHYPNPPEARNLKKSQARVPPKPENLRLAHHYSEAFSKNVIIFFSDFFTSDCASNMHGGISVMWVVLRAG